MIADMMLFAKPPAVRRSQVVLAELLPRIFQELATRAAEQGTELVITPSPLAGGPDAGNADTSSPTMMAWVDRDQVLVALRALVENALEALGQGGRVEIGLLESSPGLCGFQVTDTGPGVPLEARARLFDPYYSGREAGRGLGLGLCKAWRIATDHGGRLTLDTQFSPGARFVLELPREE
jgi:signal transduction histidine kinase